jgi:hypothetical protein
MHKMKALADTMAAAGSPISNDELVDYIITGLGSAYRAIAASLTLNNRSVPYAEFYSSVLSFEALEAQQAQAEEWSSSANAASRSSSYGNPSRPHMQEYNSAPQGGYQGGNRTYGNGGQQGQGRTGGNSGNGRNGGNGSNSRNNGNGRNGGNGNRRRWHPRCQLCGNWGHEAIDCRNHFDPNYRPDNYRSGNSASTSSNNNHHNPPWYLDTGATDHLTSDLERLHVHERYRGKDQVQVANGSCLSISHIGHSNLTGSSLLHLKDILHVPRIRKNLLSVYRLVSDNDVFVEFHRHFFYVKDKVTKKILLHGRSRGGLYPIPFDKASSTISRQASASVKVSSSQWHQRLGH